MLIRLFRDKNTHVIRSDKTGLIRQDVNICRIINFDSKIACMNIKASVNDWRERSQTHKLRVKFKQDVMHRGVADNCHIHDIVRFEIKVFLAFISADFSHIRGFYYFFIFSFFPFSFFGRMVLSQASTTSLFNPSMRSLLIVSRPLGFIMW